ncbi:hypothetical protein Pan44_01670 [Caulifigura coniformis]|uniref:Phage head-tail joining protein n=1 Tax=Caulifigura coniformis TaxID=2527983 RepID=A0A517S7P3_9PLAN|nr:hypothetical protein [Caulifigura coniformis]QDT52158.1 hypothetical protein Pan44_01670 [Caulifigura coniformis]
MIDRLRDSELDRLFADWSRPVIVCRVDQGLNSEFDDLSESATNHEVAAVLFPPSTSATRQTAMQHAVMECVFLVRSIDLPDDLPLTACRILASGREWGVIEVTRSADGQTVQIRGQVT